MPFDDNHNCEIIPLKNKKSYHLFYPKTFFIILVKQHFFPAILWWIISSMAIYGKIGNPDMFCWQTPLNPIKIHLHANHHWYSIINNLFIPFDCLVDYPLSSHYYPSIIPSLSHQITIKSPLNHHIFWQKPVLSHQIIPSNHPNQIIPIKLSQSNTIKSPLSHH